MKKLIQLLLIVLPSLSLAQKPRLIIPVGHSSSVQSVDFSSDGKYALTSSMDYTAKIWDVERGLLIHTFDNEDVGIKAAQFLPDQNKITAIYTTGEIAEGDINVGNLSSKFKTPIGSFWRATFSKDGTQLVASGRGKNDSLYYVDIPSKTVKKIVSKRRGRMPQWGSLQFPVAFTEKGLRWLSLKDGGGATVESLNGTLFEIAKFSRLSPAVVFSDDGTRMVTIDPEMKFVELWNAETGAFIRGIGQLTSGSTHFFRMAFSPDNQEVAVGDEFGNLSFFNTQTGETVRIRDPKKITIESIAYSPDSKHILVGTFTGRASIWKRKGHSPLHYLIGKTAPISEVVLAPDGNNLLISDFEAKAQLWSLQTGQLKHTFEGFTGDFHPTKNQLLTGVGREAILWDLETKEKINSFQLEKEWPVQQISFAGNDGQFLMAGQGIVQMRDKTGEQQISIEDPEFSGNRGTLGIVQQPFIVSNEVPTLESKPDYWPEHFISDRQFFFIKKNDGLFQLRDLINGKEKQLIQLEEDDNMLSADFSPEKDLLLGGMEGEEFVLWDIKSGREKNRFNTRYGPITSCLFNTSGNQFVTGHNWGYIAVWDTESFGRNQPFRIHNQSITTLAFLNDRMLITGSMDHSVKFWNYPLKNKTELASMYKLGAEDWVVSTPSGLFDASSGAMQAMHYVVNYKGEWEIIELEQLKARYYEPGLLPKLLGYTDEAIRPVGNFEKVALYPKIEIDSIESDSFLIRLKQRNGGIGRLSIFINGKEVVKEANPLPRGQGAKRDSLIGLNLKLYHNYLLRHPDSINTISIRAYNEEGWLKSPAYNLEYRMPQARARGSEDSEGDAAWIGQLDPKLYVVAIGTSNYSGTKLDLQYADQDATMMARALQSVGTALFTNGDSLEVYCFSTAHPDSTGLEENTAIQWQFAEKSNIKNAFESIKEKAKAEDVVAVYLSGHGVTYGSAEQAQFHYLTQGISSEDLSDTDIRKTFTISSEELTKWINDIPALKQVLIIDACNSGQIVENLTSGTKALNSSQIRALDRMKDRTGMFVLSGSASDKVSYEASEYGQGLLTYALLQGMLGLATRKDLEGKQTIDVMKLFQYARDKVPDLAKSINGIQTPMLGFPSRAASFDIGILDEKAKQNIPIGNKKPVVIRSNFFNETTFKDDLKLADRLETAFREESEKGADADLIYVDVYDYPNAFALSGLYKTEGDNIDITVKLFEGGENPIELDIKSTNDPKRLVRNIVREVKKVLK